jgi:hypothetical protein
MSAGSSTLPMRLPDSETPFFRTSVSLRHRRSGRPSVSAYRFLWICSVLYSRPGGQLWTGTRRGKWEGIAQEEQTGANLESAVTGWSGLWYNEIREWLWAPAAPVRRFASFRNLGYLPGRSVWQHTITASANACASSPRNRNKKRSGCASWPTSRRLRPTRLRLPLAPTSSRPSGGGSLREVRPIRYREPPTHGQRVCLRAVAWHYQEYLR